MTVVGLTSNPARYRDALVLGVNPALPAAQAISWLLPDSQIEAISTDDRFVIGSASAQLSDLEQAPPATVRAGEQLLLFLPLPLLLSVLGVATPLAGRARRDVQTGVAAGLSPRRGWQIQAWSAAIALSVGAIAGAGAVAAAARVWGRGWSRAAGEDWSTIVFPWVIVAVIVLVPVVVAALVPVWARLARALARRLPGRSAAPDTAWQHGRPPVGPMLALLGSVGAIAAVKAAGLGLDASLRHAVTSVAAVVALATLAWLAPTWSALGSSAASRLVAARLARQTRVFALASVVIAAAGAGYTAVDTATVSRLDTEYGSWSQPRDSVLVSQVPHSAVAGMVGLHDGDAAVYLGVTADPTAAADNAGTPSQAALPAGVEYRAVGDASCFATAGVMDCEEQGGGPCP